MENNDGKSMNTVAQNIENKKIDIVDCAALVICLDNDITTDTVEEIAKPKEQLNSSNMRVVFKDNSFENAVIKTNALQILKQFEIDEVVSV